MKRTVDKDPLLTILTLIVMTSFEFGTYRPLPNLIFQKREKKKRDREKERQYQTLQRRQQ